LILCADGLSPSDVIGGKRKPKESIELPATVTVAAPSRPTSDPIYEATDDDVIYEATDVDYEHPGRRPSNTGSRTYQNLVKDKAVASGGAVSPDYRAARKYK